MTTIRVEVTEEDIRNGARAAASCCPVALAARRAFGAGCAIVDGKAIVIWKELMGGILPSLRYAGQLPPVARHFVEDYDFGRRDPEPVAFDLEVEETNWTRAA